MTNSSKKGHQKFGRFKSGDYWGWDMRQLKGQSTCLTRSWDQLQVPYSPIWKTASFIALVASACTRPSSLAWPSLSTLSGPVLQNWVSPGLGARLLPEQCWSHPPRKKREITTKTYLIGICQKVINLCCIV